MTEKRMGFARVVPASGLIIGCLLAALSVGAQTEVNQRDIKAAEKPIGNIAGVDVKWADLLKGDTLDGWKQLGGKAEYTIHDGIVTGKAVPKTPNSFLATEKMYGDFELELEFKVDPRLNSGVQIRSHSLPGYKKGRVHGYQVEIDPSDRAWTGGIYDESRRGWLNPLKGNEAARKAFKQGEWNHFRVRAVGDHIETWLNGVPAADLVDPMTMKGFIALQVHGISKPELEGATVQWRKIRIKDLGEHVWKPLLAADNSLDGWSATPGGKWELNDDGVLRGTSPASDPKHGILLSDREYGNFTVRFDFKVDRGNSGFYFRVEKVDQAVAVNGFQAEIDTTPLTGGLYETGGRAWVVKSDEARMKKRYQPGEWSRMAVSAHGARITVHVNDFESASLIEDKQGRRRGLLGFQLHGGQDMDVSFRAIEILAPGSE